MLEIKNLSFSAQGRKILDDINLTIPDGKLICLTGPNGGGKTTLAKMIAGVEKPDSGQILLDGLDLVPLDPTERARAGVGYAFQQPVRFKGITVRDMLNMAAGKTLTEEELASVLQEVGLEAGEYVDRGVGTHLSGGEIKRIEIATVLLRRSRLAVFDEPEAGIDLWSFNNLVRVFENIRDRRDNSLVIISHQERILSIADEIVMIQDGKVGLRGDRKSIFPRLLCKNDDCEKPCM
ncbi:MAG: ATP-binding cassette domain-containing protein [Firmicutes bacterium]|nr:ATP-binding cassette domain-containing protein [Bacillota bacterium]